MYQPLTSPTKRFITTAPPRARFPSVGRCDLCLLTVGGQGHAAFVCAQIRLMKRRYNMADVIIEVNCILKTILKMAISE